MSTEWFLLLVATLIRSELLLYQVLHVVLKSQRSYLVAQIMPRFMISFASGTSKSDAT